MLASLVDAPLEDPGFVYEPKYDGIRAVAEIAARGGGVKLWSRLGNDKAHEFPEIVSALQKWARRRTAPLVLDGEIVALDAAGNPRASRTFSAGLTPLRVHRLRHPARRRHRFSRPPARRAPPGARTRSSPRAHHPPCASARSRTATAARFTNARSRSGWEGLIAKRADSIYHAGKRTPDWRKIKIVLEQEFVVVGWTEPKQTRLHLGALLLGVYDDGQSLLYTGRVGTGFDDRELAQADQAPQAARDEQEPDQDPPRTNEKTHWVKPQLVAQVRFTEWTADGILRHPGLSGTAGTTRRQGT